MAPPRARRFRTKSPPRNQKQFREHSPGNRGRGEQAPFRNYEEPRDHRIDERRAHYGNHSGSKHRSRSGSRGRNRSPFRRHRHRSRSMERANQSDRPRGYKSPNDQRFQEPEFIERRRSLSNERRRSLEPHHHHHHQWDSRFSPPPHEIPDRHFDELPFAAHQETNFEPDFRNETRPDENKGFGPSNMIQTQIMMDNQGYNGPNNVVYMEDPDMNREEFVHDRNFAMENSNLDFMNKGEASGQFAELSAVPEFNPETSKLSSFDWVKLIETVARDRHWKKDEKRYIMASRLAGFARHWYLTTGIHCKAWGDLRAAFLQAFPTETEYVSLLQQMLARVKEANESVSKYFLHKVALLNACEIYGCKAVSCIIAGLSNSKLKYLANKQSCKDPDQLYAFLRTQPDDSPTKPKEETPRDTNKKKSKGGNCYYCLTPGHVFANCPKVRQKSTTSLRSEKNQKNGVMTGALSRKLVYFKQFTEVNVKGVILKAYIDQTSECTTLREQNCIELNLPMKKQYKVVIGFSGSLISTIGYIEVPICIDRAIASVKLYVVPDHVQAIPVVIGQSFIKQPHVIMKKNDDNVRFYQRMDNGETNFDF